MPCKIEWLAQANDDLEDLLDYIAARNRSAALAYVQDIRRACEKLASFPESGRAYNDRYRVVVVRNHLVFYRFEQAAGKVIIAAVIDGRRDAMALLEEGAE